MELKELQDQRKDAENSVNELNSKIRGARNAKQDTSALIKQRDSAQEKIREISRLITEIKDGSVSDAKKSMSKAKSMLSKREEEPKEKPDKDEKEKVEDAPKQKGLSNTMVAVSPAYRSYREAEIMAGRKPLSPSQWASK